MKYSFAKYLLVVWFSFLLLLGNTPMEFVHLFANHKDTIHHEQKGMCIEKKHHHCAFLSLTLTSFINDYSIDFARFEPYEFVIRHYPVNDVYACHYTFSTSLRGPPAA